MRNNMKQSFLFFFSFMAVLLWWPPFAGADDVGEVKPTESQTFKAGDAGYANQSLLDKFQGSLFADFRVLTYGVIQEPNNTTQNPNNNFLQIPHYTADVELRPDLRFDSKYLELSAKPRAKLELREWEDGSRSGETQWKDDWYVNEWLVRLNAMNKVYVSYGRENLQWGPSFIFSPSNPFFRDNGRSNPYTEVLGMEFGRLVFIPSSAWTMSFIVNTDEGRNMLVWSEPFEKTYALKVDYMGGENYASVIISEKDYKKTLGYFAGWTVSDAVTLYSEGSFTQGSQALYPKKDLSILGAPMQKVHEDDSEIEPIILLGGSYTLDGGGTLTLEYVYNGPGYSKEETETYYKLRRYGALAFNLGNILPSPVGPLVGAWGQQTLIETFYPGLKMLQNNYAMLQYTQTNILNKIDLTLRWTENCDDSSFQVLTIVSYALGNHMELFTSGILNTGGEETEYGSLIKYQVMFGIKFTL